MLWKWNDTFFQKYIIPNILLLFFYYPIITLAAKKETRIALVIGNADYSISPLVNPVNDARAMSNVLTQAGFKVDKYENLNQKAMRRAIAGFGRKLPTADVGLFYYAGHGVQVKGRNYLIPVGVQIQYESDIEIETVDLAAVLSKMDGSANNLNLVILDACRNNPFASNVRSLNQGLAFTNAPSGTLIAYATAPGDVAADGDGDNGVYTKYLIKHILIPGKQIEDIFKQVRVDVKKETRNLQTPWESSSLEGDFYFFPDGKASTAFKPSNKISSTVQINTVASNEPVRFNKVKKNRPNRNSRSFSCSDMREKEAFAGGMGFDTLSQEEEHYLNSHCR